MPGDDDQKLPAPIAPGGDPAARAALQRAREVRDRTIARLSDGFAHDLLDVEEIAALAADLPGASEVPVPASAPQAALIPAAEAEPRRTVVAIMGGVDRRGAWTMPRALRVVTMMGGARLDLREARFPPGPVDIEVFAFMGGTEIIVPPGLAVQTHGTAIMGGFQEVNRAPAHPDPDAPLLRVHGMAMMGGVDIKMRLPGEDDDDHEARRRLRHERHAERRAQRALERAERAEHRRR